MLRAMECIHDLGIPQRQVAEAIGWSRTQVSLTFRRGKFPVDAERFKAGVRKWAEETPAVGTWLRERTLGVEALFDVIGNLAGVDLEVAILTVVGRVATAGPRTTDIMSMARVSRFLLEELRLRLEGDKRLPEIEAAAASML